MTSYYRRMYIPRYADDEEVDLYLQMYAKRFAAELKNNEMETVDPHSQLNNLIPKGVSSENSSKDDNTKTTKRRWWCTIL